MQTVKTTLIVILVIVAVTVVGCAGVRVVSAHAAPRTHQVNNFGVGGWNSSYHFGNAYWANHNGYGMICRSGERSIHKWTWLGNSFYYHYYSTACFRLHWVNGHGYAYFAYFHTTPTWAVCDLFCSMENPNFANESYGCTNNTRCTMVGRRNVAHISENYDAGVGSIHQQYYPWVKYIWRIVPWKPNTGQIGVTTYYGCAGC